MDLTRWVLVAGAFKDLSKEHVLAAESLGKMLGRAGYGLIVGRWSGVDAIVTRAFVDKADSNRDRLIQINTVGGPEDARPREHVSAMLDPKRSRRRTYL